MKNLKTPLKTCLRLVLVPGMLMLFLSSCLKDTNTYYAPPVAHLAVVQASPDEPPLNFFLNTNLVTQSPLLYGNFICYFNAYVGLRTANFDNANTMAQVLTDSIQLAQNVAYTLFLANTANSPKALLLTDSLTKPVPGQATVRFVDLGPDAGPVDLQIKGASTTTIADKTFEGHSGFIAVPAGTSYTLQVNASGTSTALATMSNVNLNAGGVYTVWFYGLTTSSVPADNPAIGIMTDAQYN